MQKIDSTSSIELEALAAYLAIRLVPILNTQHYEDFNFGFYIRRKCISFDYKKNHWIFSAIIKRDNIQIFNSWKNNDVIFNMSSDQGLDNILDGFISRWKEDEIYLTDESPAPDYTISLEKLIND